MHQMTSGTRKRQIGQQVVHSSLFQINPSTVVPPRGAPVHPTPSTLHQPHKGERRPRRETNQDQPKTLDGFMLLDCCRVEFPDEVAQAVLSGLNIANVVAEDLLFFTSLERLDMSDNEAPFEPFGCLPALVELDFQCNALSDISLGNGFLNLEVLNLSFNCLVSKDVEELSNLLRIRELYLCNNWIRSLPPTMDRFSRLETLSLERNNITGEEIFSLLSMVPRLRNLNLSHNRLAGFPEAALTLDNKRGTGFYNLLYLNLAHNQITEEEAVLPTWELHSLRKLILYGNPLAHAAVYSHNPTKLMYDPVPTLTLQIEQNERTNLSVVIAYPETKKKKRNTTSSYENVEIYKMIPNETPLLAPFQKKPTTNTKAKSLGSERSDQDSVATEKMVTRPIDTTDSTFLTGVGLEDAMVTSGGNIGASLEVPAVPSSMITRSLAASKNCNPFKARAAINALRYQLDHPLTSHDDSELSLANSQRPTQGQLNRQRPRRQYEPRDTEAPTQPWSLSYSASGGAHKGASGVDDALAELSHQVAKTWDRRPNLEQNVDEALDSLVSTAHKIDLTYRKPSTLSKG